MPSGSNQFSSRGTFFGDRFHAQEIATPKQARAALGYVLGNARKHAAERGRVMPERWVDPFSSARQFDGWRQPVACAEALDVAFVTKIAGAPTGGPASDDRNATPLMQSVRRSPARPPG